MNTTASVNVNKTEMHSDYQSVDKKTGKISVEKSMLRIKQRYDKLL
ncbi:hypothetical protein [Providencia vermicola]|nr:hypothetical protein [Providencia vermicola]